MVAMVRTGAVVAVLGTACGSVSSETIDAGVDAVPVPFVDAAPGTVNRSLTFAHAMVGATTTTGPLDLSGHAAEYLIEDPAEPTGLRRVGATRAGNVWQANLPEGPAAVWFTLPDRPTPIRRMFSFASLAVQDVLVEYGRADAAAAPANASIDISEFPFESNHLGNHDLTFYGVGTWFSRTIQGNEEPGTFDNTWDPPPLSYVDDAGSVFTRLTARPLEAVGPGDVLLMLRHQNSRLIGVSSVNAFTMVTAASATSAGTLTDVDANLTYAPSFDAVAAVARLATVQPAGTAAASGNWAINASPAAPYNGDAGPSLHAGTFTPNNANQTVSTTYGNPFSWAAVATLKIFQNRTFTRDARSLPLGAGVNLRQAPGSGVVAFEASLPTLVTVAGVDLVDDDDDDSGTPLVLDAARAVEVRFALDGDTCDLYQVALNKLVPGAAGAWGRELILGLTGEEPRWLVPREMFESGVLYVPTAVCLKGGFPSAASGNLQDRALPYSIGYLEGGVFTIAP